MQAWSLASLSGFRIQHCHQLWCRLQTWLGSQVAVVVVEASSYTSRLTLSMGNSICNRWSPKKTKKKSLFFLPSLYFSIPRDSICPKSSEMLRFYYLPCNTHLLLFLGIIPVFFGMNPSISSVTLRLGSRLAIFSTLIGRKILSSG